MLSRPPLQLEKNFFPSVHIEADPDFNPENKPQLNLSVKVTKKELSPADGRWVVQIDVTIIPNEESAGYYKVTLKEIGFFNVDSKIPAKDVPALVEVNGGSILFSAAREYLSILTSRGPWPPLVLPTVRIVPEESGDRPAPKEKKQAPGGKKQKTGKAKSAK